MRSTLLCITLLAIGLHGALAQHLVSGLVQDKSSKEPLAFVNIVANGQRLGTSTDIDGRFSVQSQQPIHKLNFSYVGYQEVEIAIDGSSNAIVVEMQKKDHELAKVEVFPGENPAHRIIDLVFANRKMNHGQRKVSFRYKSYSKFILTTELDSTILNDTNFTATVDTSETDEFAEWAEKTHLFLMESVTERNYLPPDRDRETVLATRVSGFKDPSILALAAQTKTYSFYEPTISIQDKNYLSPISRGSTNQYLFIIQDTIWNEQDTVFVLSYRPKTGKKFDGLQGLLYINSNGYAIQSVTAEPPKQEEGFNLRIQQLHEKVQGRQWFPVQLNTFFYLDNLQLDEWKVVGIGRTYLKDIELEPELRARDLRGPEVEVMEEAHTREEEFWKQHRVDTLDLRETNTYHFMDSIGKAEKFDRYLQVMETVITGKIPYKFIDFDLNRILAFNRYEGLRLGVGAHTNQRFSKLFKVGGYGAYGFRDKEWKYGFDGGVIFNWRKEMEFNASFEKDVLESGGIKFRGDRKPLASENYRALYIDRMDRYEKTEVSFSFRALEHFKFWFFANEQLRQTTDDYRFLSEVAEGVIQSESSFYFTEAGASLRFAYNEQLAATKNRLFSFGTKAPILYLNVTRGFDNVRNGEYDYWKYDLKFEKKFSLPRIGDPSVQLLMGYVDRDLPYTQLYNGRASFSGDDLGIAVAGSFETMRINEFLSDQYVALFLRHNFKDLLIRWGNFKPQFQLVTNIGFGSLRDPDRHSGLAFNTMEQGYFESGLHIDNLYRLNFTGIGIGGFYRYGPYSLGSFEDNVALKLTSEFVF